VTARSEPIWRRASIFGVLLALSCVARPESGLSAPDTATKIDIGKNEIGAPPAEFELSPLSEATRRSWTVVRDVTAQTGIAIEHAAAQSAEDRPPLAIYTAASLKNEEISLRLNATGGRSNQGGGIAVRLSSPQDYYLVQLDALRDRVLLSLVHAGTSEEIVGVDADIASHAWHTLTVRAKDDEFVVSLDETLAFTGFDKTLSQAGHIALWTEGDSITRFDSIAISPLPASEEKY
jgi:hypothetical protein